MHKCLGESCDRIITSRFAICRNCEKRYGQRSRNWPAWLQFLWKDEQRVRRQERRIRRWETNHIAYE